MFGLPVKNKLIFYIKLDYPYINIKKKKHLAHPKIPLNPPLHYYNEIKIISHLRKCYKYNFFLKVDTYFFFLLMQIINKDRTLIKKI